MLLLGNTDRIPLRPLTKCNIVGKLSCVGRPPYKRHNPNPTTKAGIPHVEAPESVLEKMLTLRLHLDEVDDSNGPLLVVPASHHSVKQVVAGGAFEKILAGREDILAICPLVSHSSPLPKPTAGRGRRILHFEFAARRRLPDGYRWHSFDAGMAQE